MLVVIGVVVLYVAAPAAYLAVAVHLGAIDRRDPLGSPEQLVVAQLVGYAPVALFLLAMLPRLARASLAELGLRRPSARDLRNGALGTLAMWLLVTIASAIIFKFTKHHDTENAIALLQRMKSPADQIAFFILACVLAPMIEELIFRVFIFNALTRYVSVTTAIVASGLLFGLVHALGAASTQLVTVSIPLAIGGMVLAYVYAKTRNYWANVTTHGLFNSISVIAIFVFHAK
ncbi:MAG: hypothetical protein NVS2B8_12820 [Vulcanimicrobiaceae bacterium]